MIFLGAMMEFSNLLVYLFFLFLKEILKKIKYLFSRGIFFRSTILFLSVGYLLFYKKTIDTQFLEKLGLFSSETLAKLLNINYKTITSDLQALH
jgi:hypothetical protein